MTEKKSLQISSGLVILPTAILVGIAVAWLVDPLVPASEPTNGRPNGQMTVAGYGSHLNVVAPSVSSAPTAALPSLAPIIDTVAPAVVDVLISGGMLEFEQIHHDVGHGSDTTDPPHLSPVEEPIAFGSGVIIDAENGYVLTNHHVVNDADEIILTLHDGRTLAAELLGSDLLTDVALLKIDAPDLTAITLGDSDELRVGDFVAAIGNPFGLGQTVTVGIVSALGRDADVVPGGYEFFIQTDASINPGNSGGPLITANGDFVGISSASLSSTGDNIGIGFAVPSNVARAMVDQLLEYGDVVHGQLGVETRNLAPDEDLVNTLGTSPGALITHITPGSAADKAGLKLVDLIVAIDGRPVANASGLGAQIGLLRAGTEIALTVIRLDDKRTVIAKLQQLPPDNSSGEFLAALFNGLTLSEISRDAPIYGHEFGIVVDDIAPDNVAAMAGLRRGDIIVAIDHVEVVDRNDFEFILQSKTGLISLDVVRNSEHFHIVLG